MGNICDSYPGQTWWTVIGTDADFAQAGIYEWRIGDQFVYIGKSKRLRSRIREYPNNVRKMETGAPYRRGKPDGYREIHHELYRASLAKIPVFVTVLENCETSMLNQREQHWIAVRRTSEIKDGGPRVLNSIKVSQTHHSSAENAHRRVPS